MPASRAATSPPPARRLRRRRLALLIFLPLTLLLLLGLLEGLARALGHRPFVPATLHVRVEPGGRLFQPHPQLGYTHLPGAFTVTLPDGYTFRMTHDTNTLRLTHPSSSLRAARPGLWVMGCSFVHGWSLNDEETMPWQLQTLLPEYEVFNFGVNGYGTLHAWLQYQEFRRQLPKPRVVVVDYAYFHDERNVLTRARRKAVAPYNRLGPIHQPWARLDQHGCVEVQHTPLDYVPWPGQQTFALVNWLEQGYCALETRWSRGQAVSLAVLQQFARQCREEGIFFVVAGITRGKDTARVLQNCAERGIATVDISVSLSEPGSRNLPHDDHPSARSQAEYARKLAAFLRAQKLNLPSGK
ncbi:SGNH/GDSL hydrolase family protein [Fontisphaera persica]|uniref:SGNH/GDSL hydrolase family protein n=1 Tax=Fontisphaera persica TaxID=2974023 RepID=UPI0024C05390|nr:SGNH/GDSL hydrolase family protein [Fontisphaera persica]WCJ58050.1 SGNH/GDSL hydrolase family protein [Fontisphaera persica]